MAAVPRILRVVPKGPITRSERGIPVLVVIRWHQGQDAHVPALATAWTAAAVEVMWQAPDGDLRTDWLPARDVSRPDSSGQNRSPQRGAQRSVHAAEPPPTRRGPGWSGG